MKMEQTESENQLLENLHKCRCCFRMIINQQKAVNIDDTIRNQFFNLTKIELLSSDIFASRICQLCKSDLQAFSDLRKDLVEKQSNLYQLAGIDLNEEEPINEIEEEQIEDDQDMQIIEKLDGTNEFESEIILENDYDYDENEIIYDDKESIADGVLKIEKIDQDNEDLVQEDDTEYIVNYFQDSNEVYSSNNDQSNSFDEDMNESELCQICNVEVFKGHFKEHIEAMHSGENSCVECQLKFDSKILLKKHINEEHTAEIKSSKTKKKLQYCPLCSKEYDYKKQLLDHIRSFHRKERNAQCHVCKRKFYHRDLKKHIQHVHGEKKISCDICGKMYSCQENLKLHMKYHSEPKYVCDQSDCGKKFHQKILLEHHMLKHKNERNIACSECNNAFYTVRDLKRHNQRVHNKVSRKCFDCDMAFCRKDKYREHILKQHKNLTDESRDKILEQIKNLKWHDVQKFDDEY